MKFTNFSKAYNYSEIILVFFSFLGSTEWLGLLDFLNSVEGLTPAEVDVANIWTNACGTVLDKPENVVKFLEDVSLYTLVGLDGLVHQSCAEDTSILAELHLPASVKISSLRAERAKDSSPSLHVVQLVLPAQLMALHLRKFLTCWLLRMIAFRKRSGGSICWCYKTNSWVYSAYEQQLVHTTTETELRSVCECWCWGILKVLDNAWYVFWAFRTPLQGTTYSVLGHVFSRIWFFIPSGWERPLLKYVQLQSGGHCTV